MRIHSPLPLALLTLLVAAPLAAQVEPGRFQVSTSIGWQRYDEAAALDGTGFGAIDAVYFFTPRFGLGGHLDVARPTTRGEYFPVVALQFGDSTSRYLPDQLTLQLTYGFMGVLRFPATERIAPYAAGGIGRSTFFLDPEQNRGERRESFTTWTAGVGLEYAPTQSLGIHLDVRDNIMTGFEREVFNLADPLFFDRVLPHPNDDIPEAKSTIHNIRLSLAFSFIPSARER